MPDIFRARVATLALSVAIIAGTSADGFAKARAKKPHVAAAPAIAASAAPPAIQTPFRFFTINAVLAKLDGHAGEPAPVRVAAINATVSMTDAAAPSPQILPASLPATSGEPFNLFAFRAPEGLLWVKWRGVEAEVAKEADVIAQCRSAIELCPSPAAIRFIALVDAARGRQARDKLETVNRAVNAAIRYMSDYAQHGVADVWSAPLATFTTGRGDCKDYAIAKYVALREAGFPADDLRLLLVRDTAIREDHAMLAARLAGHWLILDNRFAALVEDSEAGNLMPLFAIDQQGVKLLAAPYVSRDREARENDMAPATAE